MEKVVKLNQTRPEPPIKIGDRIRGAVVTDIHKYPDGRLLYICQSRGGITVSYTSDKMPCPIPPQM
jgi:hypothetical protein